MSRPLAASIGIVISILVAACAGPEPIASLDGPGGTAELTRDGRGLGVRIAEGAFVRLEGFSEARLVGVIVVGADKVAVASGVRDGCGVAHALAIFPPTGPTRLERIPGCEAEYAFVGHRGQLLATQRGTGRTFRQWRYADGSLTGPWNSSSATARRVARSNAPPRSGTQEAGGQETREPVSQAAEETQPDIRSSFVLPPRVSSAVGEDVIPQEVGVTRGPAAPVVSLQ